MQVRVGPHDYVIELVNHPPLLDGREANGICDANSQRIEIYRHMPPSKRIAVGWHELAHAFQAELDIHQAPSLDAEAMANLIGIAMAHMDARLLVRLHTFLLTGIDCVDAMFIPGIDSAVPIVRGMG